MTPANGDENALLFLEHYPDMEGHVHRVKLNQLPFKIGRDSASDYVVYSNRVSKHHAEIAWASNKLIIRDLGSTNGTYHNGHAITEAALESGDILHIAHKEFRFIRAEDAGDLPSESCRTQKISPGNPPESLIQGTNILREILHDRRVHVLFQPIFRLDTNEMVAFESLGRCNHPELGPSPTDLLKLAQKCNLAPSVSQLWRSMAFLEALRIPGRFAFFFNIHPAEVLDDELVDSLAATADRFRSTGCRIILEINENAITNVASVRNFHRLLSEIGIGLAFDDFGSGQTRLHELADAPPDFIKIDMNLVRDIHQSAARQDIVRALAEVAASLGTKVIAEGVETQPEADTCRRLGCLFGQGYLFGHPAPAATFFQPDVSGKTEIGGVSRTRLREIIRRRQESSAMFSPGAGKK